MPSKRALCHAVDNNNFDRPFTYRPGFRESAFQPIPKEEDQKSSPVVEVGSLATASYHPPSEAEVEDSEGDEVVDIERIEDKEEDTLTSEVKSN